MEPVFWDEAKHTDGPAGVDLSRFRDELSRAFREVDLDALADTLGHLVSALRESAPDHAFAMDAASGILFMAVSLLPEGVITSYSIHYTKLYEYLPGHGDGGDVAEEERVPEGEPQLREGIGREARGKQLQEGHDDRELRGIRDKKAERDLRPNIYVVLPSGKLGNPS